MVDYSLISFILQRYVFSGVMRLPSRLAVRCGLLGLSAAADFYAGLNGINIGKDRGFPIVIQTDIYTMGLTTSIT